MESRRGRRACPKGLQREQTGGWDGWAGQRAQLCPHAQQHGHTRRKFSHLI